MVLYLNLNSTSNLNLKHINTNPVKIINKEIQYTSNIIGNQESLSLFIILFRLHTYILITNMYLILKTVEIIVGIIHHVIVEI